MGVVRIKIVFTGGSSRILRMAFWAGKVILWASSIQTILWFEEVTDSEEVRAWI